MSGEVVGSVVGSPETPEQAVARLILEVRAVAPAVSYGVRAFLVREVVKSVRDAVKFDPLVGDMAPAGREWELDGLGGVDDAAKKHYFAALHAHQAYQAEQRGKRDDAE
jgi:hypothetical protein